jgi:hypothetical protein
LNVGQRRAVNAILGLHAAVRTAREDVCAAERPSGATAEPPEEEEEEEAAFPQPAFVVFGPPGTGKTLTVVEAVMQLLARNPRHHSHPPSSGGAAADGGGARSRSPAGSEGAWPCGNCGADDERREQCAQCGAAPLPPPPPPAPLAVRVLLCAPSEAAANVLCLRLAALGVAPAAMRRLAWWQVGLESLPPQLLRFTVEGHGGVLVPDCLPTDSYEVVKLAPYENPPQRACARAAFECFFRLAC